MDYRFVDILNADQLEVGDLIGWNSEVVKIIAISSLHYGYSLVIENEFGEKDSIDISEDEKIELFIFE
jgi:hypothetical protein